MKSMKEQKITQEYYIPIQLKLPLNFEKIIKFSEPVYSFNEVMNHIDLNKYFVDKEHKISRPRYDCEKLCETDIRFMWILDETNPPCIYKPIESHNLMQAIARVNRVFGDKVGGLVVDYIGIAGALKQAMTDYTSRDKEKFGNPDIINTAYQKFLEKL